MTIAERLVDDYNNADAVEIPYQVLVRRQIRKWQIEVELNFTEQGTIYVQIFQFEDGSIAIVPDTANATAIDPSFPAAKRLL